MLKSSRHRLLWLAAIGFISSIARAEENNDFCGKPLEVAQFTLEHGGHRYVLPAYVSIRRDGVTLFEDKPASKWGPPYNGAEFSSFREFLLLQTFEQDCIDIYLARLFMIAPDGSVINQPVWTSNWRAGFFVADDKLTYWSEWFCRPNNSEREEGMSYVYVFSEDKKAFERQAVDDSVYCEHSGELRFLRFTPAKAIP